MGIAWEMMAFAGAATSMCVGCLVPNRWLPPLPNDKLMHFAGFALLTALGLRIADSTTGRECGRDRLRRPSLDYFVIAYR